jgi:hypothetical protein
MKTLGIKKYKSSKKNESLSVRAPIDQMGPKLNMGEIKPNDSLNNQ